METTTTTTTTAAAEDTVCYYCKKSSDEPLAKMLQLGVNDSLCHACADKRPLFQHSSGAIFTLTKLAPHWARNYEINADYIILPTPPKQAEPPVVVQQPSTRFEEVD